MSSLGAGLGGVAVDSSNISNLKDIMLTYNKITEACFNRCVSSLNSKSLSEAEEKCVHCCSGKFVTGNQRIMTTFMGVQSKRQEGMAEEQRQKELEQKKANAALLAPPATEPTVSPSQPEVLQRVNVLYNMNKNQQEAADVAQGGAPGADQVTAPHIAAPQNTRPETVTS